MKYQKPLTAAAVITGLVIGGAGVAAAGEDGPRNSDQNPAEQGEAVALQVQLEDGDDAGPDGDNDDDNNDDNNNGEENQRQNRRGQRLASLAEVLGVEADLLGEALQDGATIADIAEENSIGVDEVVDALIANVEERLDAKIEAGDITEEEAADKLEAKTERITDRVNGVDGDDDDGNPVNAQFNGRNGRGNGQGNGNFDGNGAEQVDVDLEFDAHEDPDAVIEETI